ncbi:DUF3795 domain-containing protein [Candidatus Bipolaricaulota bacterium]|nr:DUF3795 domain-containing protein [Candidatus Bipolaricaulota bacterium]
MEKENMASRNPEAFCGLYSGACPVYLKRDHDWIVKKVLEEHGMALEDLHCDGCRTDVLSPSCQHCATRDCAKRKGLDSCSQCSEMPCEGISGFGKVRPHGVEVVGNLMFLRDNGSEAWLAAQDAQWRCNSCGRVGSWYERTCEQCGAQLPAGYEAKST